MTIIQVANQYNKIKLAVRLVPSYIEEASASGKAFAQVDTFPSLKRPFPNLAQPTMNKAPPPIARAALGGISPIYHDANAESTSDASTIAPKITAFLLSSSDLAVRSHRPSMISLAPPIRIAMLVVCGNVHIRKVCVLVAGAAQKDAPARIREAPSSLRVRLRGLIV